MIDKCIEKLEILAINYKRMLNDEYEHRGYTAEYFNYMNKYDSLTAVINLLEEYKQYGYTK